MRALPYIFILIDIAFSYYHHLFRDQPAVTQWYYAITGMVARIPLWLVFAVLQVPLNKYSRTILIMYCLGLVIDFFQQVFDENYGIQLWELVMFLLAAAGSSIFYFIKDLKHESNKYTKQQQENQ